MKTVVKHIVLVFFAALAIVSCGKKAKIIPKSDMMDIYADLYLADQWLQANDEEFKKVDSLLFYEPIFNKYGYTTDDFRESIFHYLGDPKRFARMIDKVAERLREKSDRLEAYQQSLLSRESERKKFESGIDLYYDSLFFSNTGVFEIDIVRDSSGIYLPRMEWLEPAVDTLTEKADSIDCDDPVVESVVDAVREIRPREFKSPGLRKKPQKDLERPEQEVKAYEF